MTTKKYIFNFGKFVLFFGLVKFLTDKYIFNSGFDISDVVFVVFMSFLFSFIISRLSGSKENNNY